MARRKKTNDDQNQENLDPTDDTFGLPEIEYEPLKRDVPKEETTIKETVTETTFVQPEPPVQEIPKQPEPRKFEYVEDNQFYEPEEEESPSVWPKILGLLLILALAGGVIWYFVSWRPKQLAADAKARREQLAIQEEDRKKELERQKAEELLAEERRKTEAQVAAIPPPGTIEALSSRTGRYYVVVASSIDGDLVMDYAKKLSKKGVTSKIIPPFGKSKFHRLAVAEGDTYINTQATADGMKGGDYGDKVWVVKY